MSGPIGALIIRKEVDMAEEILPVAVLLILNG